MKKIWLKNYPSSVSANLPELKTGLLGEFEKTCLKYENQTAFISFGVKISYKELYQKSYQLSQFLKEKGMESHSVMAIQLPNLLQYPVSLWGSLMAGLKILNLNPLYTGREMLLPLRETQAQGIILLPDKLKELKGIIDQTQIRFICVTQPGDLLAKTSVKNSFLQSAKKHIINLAYKHKTKTYKRKDLTSDLRTQYSFLSAFKKDDLSNDLHNPKELSEKSSSYKESSGGLNQTLFIQYTGGTTGVIKGACLSERSILSNAKQCQTWMSHWLKESEEKALAALPLYHIFSFTVNGLVFFFHGYPNVLVADPRNIKSLIRTLRKQKITIGTGVNTLFKALLSNKKFKKIKKSQLKVFVSGGMALDPSVREEWELKTKSFLVEGYGLTEASPVVCVDRLDNQKDNSSGYPLPSTEIRIVEGGKELEINQVGELEIKGPQIMQGYYKQEEETKKVLSSDGWLKTGDLAKVNSRGGIEILGRKKELINVSGLKVYPREVEELLSLHPKVKEAAIVGRLNKKGAEIVKAYIVKKQDSLTEEEILSYCKKNLAPYKIPKEISFEKSFIKSAAGKPLKRTLK